MGGGVPSAVMVLDSLSEEEMEGPDLKGPDMGKKERRCFWTEQQLPWPRGRKAEKTFPQGTLKEHQEGLRIEEMRRVDSVAGDKGGKLEKCDLWRTQLSQMSPESKGFSEERLHRVGRLGAGPQLCPSPANCVTWDTGPPLGFEFPSVESDDSYGR